MDSEPFKPQPTLYREQGRYALVAGYVAIWLLMTVLSLVALGYMTSIQEQLRDIVAVHNTKKDLVKQMHGATRERVFSLQHMFLLDDPFERDAESLKIYQHGVTFSLARENFMHLPLAAREQSIMSDHAELARRAGPTQRAAMLLIMDDRMEQARNLLIEEVIPIQQQAMALLKELEEYQDASIKQALQQGEQAFEDARILLVTLGGFAVLLLLIIAIKVFKVLRSSAQAINDEKERLRITLHSIGDGVIATDSAGIVEYLNPIAERYTGWNSDKARGVEIFRVFNIINAADGKPVAKTIDDLIDDGRNNDIHHHSLLRCHDDSTIAVDYTASAIRHNDGSVSGYVMIFRDESRLREMAHHLSHQATHDPLTNLTNRREFERHLESLLKESRTTLGEHVLCYLDLDRFKIVNDTCGHAAGDELLKQIVALFKQRVRSNDLLARIGGDEFGLLLENCPVQRAMGITDEIRDCVHRYRFIWKGQSFQIGVSIGMVVIDNHWNNLSELLAAADAACYAAKDGGRNRIHLYLTAASGTTASSDESWPERIRHALEHDRLVHYSQQPVALRSSAPQSSYVYLQLRIMEHGRQRLPFAPLLPHAERHGLAARIDRWSVEHALILAVLREETSAIYSVALSAASLQDEHFASDISALALQRDISPAQICLELPENYLMANIQAASKAALELTEMGFRIALDGTGQSIGTHDALRTLPFDYLRVHGDFIHEAMDDPILQIQFEANVRMAHSVGMHVVAMDIQSRQLIEQLDEIGIDYLSGHGIAKPQPAIALLISESIEKTEKPKPKRIRAGR